MIYQAVSLPFHRQLDVGVSLVPRGGRSGHPSARSELHHGAGLTTSMLKSLSAAATRSMMVFSSASESRPTSSMFEECVGGRMTKATSSSPRRVSMTALHSGLILTLAGISQPLTSVRPRGSSVPQSCMAQVNAIVVIAIGDWSCMGVIRMRRFSLASVAVASS